MNSGDLIQRLKEKVEDRIVNRYGKANAYPSSKFGRRVCHSVACS